MHRYLVLGVILISCAYTVVCQTPKPRCYQFTWLGPEYNNQSNFRNATCADKKIPNTTPCVLPLVVSKNGTWPDLNHIWEYYRDIATCELLDNYVCAKYTYYFNNYALNSTYMCTRAVDKMGFAITDGCYEHRNGSFVTKVCFCRTIAGVKIPCNDAVISSILSTTTFLIALAINIKNILIH